jgi:hypothetical protein
MPAASVQNPHTGRDPASQELIEEVDVDLSEILLKAGHGGASIIPTLAAISENATPVFTNEH